jgi:hypothetical protein
MQGGTLQSAQISFHVGRTCAYGFQGFVLVEFGEMRNEAVDVSQNIVRKYAFNRWGKRGLHSPAGTSEIILYRTCVVMVRNYSPTIGKLRTRSNNLLGCANFIRYNSHVWNTVQTTMQIMECRDEHIVMRPVPVPTDRMCTYGRTCWKKNHRIEKRTWMFRA